MLQELFTYPFLIRILNKILNDNDKIKIIELNKILNDKRTKFTYDKEIFINITFKNSQNYWTTLKDYSSEITGIHHIDSWYYDCLTNIVAGDVFDFPKSITHLKFFDYFDQPILNCIPNSVINLSFGDEFNQSIEDCIPNSVKYLKFGVNFTQSILNCIPNSVTHLTITKFTSEEIENLSNVTHLIIDHRITKTNKIKFPRSLIFLCAGKKFLEFNKENIPSNVEIKGVYLGWD